MNFNDFSNVVKFEGLAPETHDFYLATFSRSMDYQTFLDHAYQQIQDLQGLWFKSVGNSVYFIVPLLTVIPDDFADSVTKATDETEVLDQPVTEE